MSTVPPRRAELVERFVAVREATERLAAPLSAEDQVLQATPSSSPTKWHRAHTTWFFETFVLAPRGVAVHEPRWGVLFNSYYVAIGPRHARPKRGLLSRPTVEEVAAYRRAVDRRVTSLLREVDDRALEELAPVVELGLAHEQQHQELLLTDILAAFAENPLAPVYRAEERRPWASARPMAFRAFGGGVREIGAAPSSAFRFDNEEPRHRVFVEPFVLGDRLVTVAEWKAFVDEGGYDTPSLWLSEGFDWVRTSGARAPLYARQEGGALVALGLGGERELDDAEPIAHLSFYEAEALARFLGARLPTEAEWEVAAGELELDPNEGNFVEDGVLRPSAAGEALQLFGDAWEWTASAYGPYPGYHAPPGAVGEYNGKFMVNQLVLRGGSALTPRGHVRATYRNFWHPETRFQMTGLRLARSEAR